MLNTDPSVLVLVEEPLRAEIVSAVRTNGYEAHACKTPLDVIQILERYGKRIAYAVLSPAAPRALEVRELLADEYPSIQPLVLST
jgi:hypothetical protein